MDKKKTHVLFSLSPQTVSIPVFVISIGVDFSLSFQVNNQLSFPPDGNSLSPVKLAVEVSVLIIPFLSAENSCTSCLVYDRSMFMGT